VYRADSSLVKNISPDPSTQRGDLTPEKRVTLWLCGMICLWYNLRVFIQPYFEKIRITNLKKTVILGCFYRGYEFWIPASACLPAGRRG
jgi:hypothetical protein